MSAASTAPPLAFVEAFAGIGGFGLGFEEAGMRLIYQIEIHKARLRLLTERWPNVPKGGDIHDIAGADMGSPDVIGAGFPCKQTSIASTDRSGLRGKDSKLYWEYHRLVGELLRLVGGSNPRWVVIENTPGLLSSPRGSKGADMAAVLAGLEQLGYGVAARVVDGNYFGIPQRRPRVVIVGHRGGDPRPAMQVLGIAGAGDGTDPPHHVGRPPRRPRVIGGSEADGERYVIFRKSRRPSKSIETGGIETWVRADYANTLTGNDSGQATRQTHLIVDSWFEFPPRTFTLTEWERLSGFPDGWTEGMSDSDRFRALGDCFQPVVAKWLGEQIIRVDAALPQIGVAA